MSATFKPLDPKLLNKPAGQCAFQQFGTPKLLPFGHATATFKKSATKTEIRTPESPGREIIATDYSELSGSVDIEFGAMNELGQSLAYLGNVKPYTQAAVPARTQTFLRSSVNDWLELRETDDASAQGVVGAVVTAVEVGGVALPAAAWRNKAGETGVIQITAWPEDADAEETVEVTWSAPAIVASAGQSVTELLQVLSLRGRFVLVQNNLRGINRKIIIPTLSFGGDGGGDVQWITDGNDIVKVSVSGTMEADYSQPAGREYGYMVDTKKVQGA